MSTENFPDKKAELPAPWYWDNSDMVSQLNREIPDGHILTDKALITIGRRQDCDDVLFEIVNDEYKYAVVHLTWASNNLSDKIWPLTRMYKDWLDVFNNCILIDAQYFEE